MQTLKSFFRKKISKNVRYGLRRREEEVDVRMKTIENRVSKYNDMKTTLMQGGKQRKIIDRKM